MKKEKKGEVIQDCLFITYYKKNLKNIRANYINNYTCYIVETNQGENLLYMSIYLITSKQINKKLYINTYSSVLCTVVKSHT